MKTRSLVSIDDLTTVEIMKILKLAAEFEKDPVQEILHGKVVATLFFEPSTRTRLSFESAVSKLGGKVIGFTDSSTSSVSKGETLNDTIRTVNNYVDMIVMRHPIEGSARYASEISTVPVINAGDGANQHPTQTLLDLYSILKTQGTLDNLNICMAMSRWNTSFNFVAPEELKMPDEYKLYLDNIGLKYNETADLQDVINKADIIYMTRVQKERFSDPIEYEKVKNAYVLHDHMLSGTKPGMKILHPLPRVNEINPDVDSNAKAYYFEQALNGVYTRQAIICTLLGLK
jgi:aspartate carbamoyltransferase catalytic subunit